MVVIALLLLGGLLIPYERAYCSEEAAHKSPGKQGSSQEENPLASKILLLAEILSNEKPLLEDVLKVLGIRDIALSKNNSVMVQGAGYKAYIRFINVREELLLNEVYMYINTLNDLKFEEVTPILGEWKLISESKTSSVRFLHKNLRTNEMAVIYVRLFDQPRNPRSPVTSISIRGKWPPPGTK